MVQAVVSFSGWLTRGKQLANPLYSIAATAATPLATVLLGVIIARMVGAQEFANYSVALALVSPVLLLSGAGIRIAHISDVKGEVSDRGYLTFRLVGLMVASLILPVLARYFISSDDAWRVVSAIFFIKSVDSLADHYHGILIKEARHGKSAYLQCGRAVVLLGVTAVCFFSDIEYLYALNLAAALSLVWIIGQRKGLFEMADFKALWRLTSSTLPLLLALSLITLNSTLPRLIVARMGGVDDVTAVSAAFYVVSVVVLIAAGLGNILTPELASLHSERRRGLFITKLILSIRTYGVVALVLIPLSYFMGERAIEIVYGQEISGTSGVVVVFSVGAVITLIQSFVNNALMAAQLRLQLLVASAIGVFAALVSFFLSNRLMPDYLVMEAAAGWSIGCAAQTVYSVMILKRYAVQETNEK